MATTISSLGVSLFARTTSFEKGMQRAKRTVRNFSRDIKRSVSVLTGYGVRLTALALGGGLGVLLGKTFENIDATAKMADTFGIATEELVSYQTGADLAGVSTGQFNQNMIAFTKRVGEARQGVGPLTSFLKKYDEELLNAITRTGNQADALALVADAMKNATSDTDRAAIANAAFSRSGVTMVNFLREGSAALKDAEKEAQRLGITFSRFDAAKVEQANDALLRLKTFIRGILNTAAIELSSVVQGLSEKLVQMGIDGQLSAENIVIAIQGMIDGAARMIDIISLIQAGWFGFKGVIEATAGTILDLVNKLIQGTKILLNTIATPARFIGKLTDRLGITEASEALFTFSEEGSGAAEFIANAFDDASTSSFQKMTELFKSFSSSEAQEGSRKFFEDIKKRSEDAARTIAENTKKRQDDARKTAEIESQEFKNQFARAIDLSRVAIGGGAGVKRAQEVKDPQLQTTNRFLQTISNKIGQNAAVVV